ncbi:MAG: zinc-binding dehydrogenase [Promethearchaeota archaeon]
MKAAVFEDIKKIVYREDYPKPNIGPDDALIKVHYCGICGTDINNFKYKIYQTPLIMGHEVSGVVEKIGENITEVKVGDKVICFNVKLDVSHKQLEGIGLFQDGGFAEYIKVPKKYLFQIPDNTSLKEAVMIETLSLAMRAIKLSGIDKNQNIMIIGGGNVGLTFLNVLKEETKPNFVIVIEPHEFLREKAKEMGANEALPPNKVKIKKYFKKKGSPTFIFDCVGSEDTLILAMEFIEREGTVLLEGIHEIKSIPFPIFLINSKEIHLQGCLGHDRHDILAAIDFFLKNKVDANKLISEIIALKDIQKTFEKFLETGERKFIKILIKIA